MILVWSTRLNPAATARARTACRTRTTSSEVRTGKVSSVSTIIYRLVAIDDAADHRQALVHVQGGADAGERQAEFHQGDRHGRAHADHHGDRVQHARHGG